MTTSTPTAPAPLTLYASPYACSLAAHVALVEGALAHDVVWLRRPVADAAAFATTNPKRKVPALALADGTVVTENLAVLLAIAERCPAAELAPPLGSSARTRLHEWLSFVATELHKQVLSAHFDPAVPVEMKAHVARVLPELLGHPEAALARSPWLVGDRFTVADAYLAWVLLLVPQLGVTLAPFPALAAYLAAAKARPAMRTVLALERRAAAAAA